MAVSARALAAALGAAGALLAGAALVLALLSPGGGMTAWLAAAVAAAGLPAGALCLLMMIRLIPGVWGDELRLSCEAGALTAPLAGACFIPVLLTLPRIYAWAAGGVALEAARAFWLTPLTYAVVTIGWFLFLFGFAWWMRARIHGIAAAAIGLILFATLGTFAFADWLMSLDLDFASSAFGLQLFVISLLVAYCAILLLRLGEPAPILRPGVLGGLLLTLLLFWAYLSFLSYFIIWSGNLPAGVGWFLTRLTPGWSIVLWVSAALGGVPLLMLLFPTPRRSRKWLAWLAVAVLLGRLIEIAWYALPPYGAEAGLLYALACAGLVLLSAAALLVARGLRIARRAPRREAAA